MKLQFNKDRPVSWSQISSFEYSPEQWHKKYVLHGKCTKELCLMIEEGRKCPLKETSVEMEFGKMVGERLASDPLYLPEVPRLSKYEHPFKVSWKGIPLVGYADNFCEMTKRKIYEFKTGVKKWDQKRVDGHGQLDMYALQNYLIESIRPEEVELTLVWLPTKKTMQKTLKTEISFVEPIVPQIFKTKRTMVQCLEFANRIERTVKEMEKYALNYKT